MRSLWTCLRGQLSLAWRTDPRRLAGASVLLLVGYLATPTVALLLKQLTDATLDHGTGDTRWLALATAVVLVFELMMGHFAHLLYFELGELAEASLQDDLLCLANGTAGLEQLDSPKFADILNLVREDLPGTRAALEAVLQLSGIALQLLISTVLLGWISPWLVLLPAAALPPVLLGRRAQAVTERAKEATAEGTRLSRHLLGLATSAGPVRELRIYGAERELLRRQGECWESVSETLHTAQLRAALLRAAGQLSFALAYGAAIVIVVRQAVTGRSGIGDVVLLITLAVQISTQVATGLGLLATLQSSGHVFERLTQLAAWPQTGDRVTSGPDVPDRLRQGIRLEGVAFHYPGTEQPVLEDVNLTIAPGTTVALVGENGAGKSTLVKLLCGMYQPTQGRILVDGIDLRNMSPRSWTARVAPLFQDFARLHLLVRENIGIGDVSAIGDDEAIHGAMARAGADKIVARVPGGLDGLLGSNFGDGAELSGGQWQTLGLARTEMRGDPLLLVLDEPASALDATAEYAIFERFGATARQARHRSGALTLFISHRFSTVRMADLIVVLGEGRVVESGSHEQLMARSGTYAELFAIQARGYSS